MMSFIIEFTYEDSASFFEYLSRSDFDRITSEILHDRAVQREVDELRYQFLEEFASRYAAQKPTL